MSPERKSLSFLLQHLFGNRGADDSFSRELSALRKIVARFELATIQPQLQACEAVAADNFIDVAVVGQFKSGKSSLLNAILGARLLPVGVLPVTAIVTRLSYEQNPVIRVTYLDGSRELVVPDSLAEFVTESANAENWRRVSSVDVLTPVMHAMPGIRLVDTPGLGSAFAHNTEVTHRWLPNLSAAIIAISAERPLSQEDIALITKVRRTAPRVAILLTKVDLLSNSEREEVYGFIESKLRALVRPAPTLLMFSDRSDTSRWVEQLSEQFLLPIVGDVTGERQRALTTKLLGTCQYCRDFLNIGLVAAERDENQRGELRAAILNEKVSIDVLSDELTTVEQSLQSLSRPAFEKTMLAKAPLIEQRISNSLLTELPNWKGNLAEQTAHFENWMNDRLMVEIASLADDFESLAQQLLATAEVRIQRIVEAFRDRLLRNIQDVAGVTVSPLEWEASPAAIPRNPPHLGQVFMVHWDLLWWLLPMQLVGALFRRQAMRRVTIEVDTNLRRSISNWVATTNDSITQLRREAFSWSEREIIALERALAAAAKDSEHYRNTLNKIQAIEASLTHANPKDA